MDYITRLKQNKKPNLNDIDLQEIVFGFERIYTKEVFVMVTNSKSFREVHFKNRRYHLHHLLGFHYLSNHKYSKRAAKVMDKIYDGTITLADIKKDENFRMIKDRLLMIRLLFLIPDRSIESRLCEPLSKTRTMDLGIIERDSSEHIVLGIGKEENGYYFFQTLEVYSEVFTRSRKYKIIKTYSLSEDK